MICEYVDDEKGMIMSIEAVVELLLLELRDFGDVGVAMEGVISVESISVLTAEIIAFKHWIRVPTFTIKVGMVSGESAVLCLWLLSLGPLIGFAVSRIEKCVGHFKGFMCCGLPVSLYITSLTFHPGCARCISDLPYLLLDATFEVSISASLFKLNPVEESP